MSMAEFKKVTEAEQTTKNAFREVFWEAHKERHVNKQRQDDDSQIKVNPTTIYPLPDRRRKQGAKQGLRY